jgi:hypothetical protein
MNVEVSRIPAVPELTSIPEAVTDYFASEGKQVLLVHGGPNNMAMESAYQRAPVYWDEIRDEKVRKAMRASFEPPERTGGVVMRGTMALVCQSFEARDFFRGVAEQKKMAMQDASDHAADAIAEQVNQAAAERNPGRSRKFVDVRQIDNPKVEEQAVGGQDILERVLQAEATKKK